MNKGTHPRRRSDSVPGEVHLRYVSADDAIEMPVTHDAGVFEQAPSAAAAPLRRFDPPAEPLNVEMALRTVGLKKSYRKGKSEVPVLRGVDMSVPNERFSVILGQSGSGKSTLLHLLGTLDAPDDGEIHFHDARIDNLGARQKETLRNQHFGMIFQFYHLLPELSALENVLMPRMIGDSFADYFFKRRKYVERAKYLLDLVGLSHRLRHRPSQLSGGEMQRTAIARALLTDPELLLADEPTGNLDEKTGRGVLEILRTLNAEQKLTIVMVTHDNSIARQADHVVALVDGQVQTASAY